MEKKYRTAEYLKTDQGLQLHRHILFSLSSSLRTGRQRFWNKCVQFPQVLHSNQRGGSPHTSQRPKSFSYPSRSPKLRVFSSQHTSSIQSEIWFGFVSQLLHLHLKKENLLQELSLKNINLKTVKIDLLSIFQNWSQPFPCQDKRHFCRSNINLWLVLDDLHMQPK